MDALTQLFIRFPFRTDLFFVGQLCRLGHFDEPNKGYLHFIRQGHCRLKKIDGSSVLIEQPSIVFSPSQVLHQIQPIDADGLEIFCVSFDFGQGVLNPLTHTLHNLVHFSLAQQPDLQAAANLIFTESLRKTCGYQGAIHHLCAFFTIQVVRCCLEQKLLKSGLLRGLTDKQLAKLLQAIHQQPELDWQVEKMAEYVAMSKSAFASYFKEIMGVSPMNYLTSWRIAVAQMLLQQGFAVAIVAEKVGYSQTSVLSRIFQREIGLTPTEWLLIHRV